MDLWDLTRLLFKRWYAAVPMLLLTIGAAAWTITYVEPDYIATAHIQLLPPATTLQAPINTAKTPTSTPHNPWLDLGLGAIGTATSVTVQDKGFIKQMEAAQLSDTFTITMADQIPLVTIEVVGQSSAQAKDTVEYLVKAFDRNIVNLQNSYGAPKTEKISTRRLDMGENVTTSRSKVKRALVAIVGAGLLLTAALTIGLDAILRRRSRKQGDRVAVASTPGGPAPSPDRGPAGAAAPIARPATAQNADMEATRSLWLPGRKAPDDGSPLNVSTGVGDEPRNGTNGGRRVPTGESTIVLPNIHGSVYGRRDNDQDPE